MKKILIIEKCSDCPHFDNEYYNYREVCTNLGRKIQHNEDDDFIIPDDCPLETKVE